MEAAFLLYFLAMDFVKISYEDGFRTLLSKQGSERNLSAEHGISLKGSHKVFSGTAFLTERHLAVSLTLLI